jgi:ABC-type phosphate transport system substrate-binding protein
MGAWVKSRQRRAFVFVAAFIALPALALGLAGPAAADPSTTFVAVGSDTTQDVVDQFAIDAGGGTVGSWDAVNPGNNAAHDEINPKPGCGMTRPNGSGEGLAALRKSLNPNTTATQLADPPEQGCVDFSRSSSGPGGNASTTGALQYIPFGLDAVATATGPATAAGAPDPASATAIAHADAFTQAQVADMYDNCNAQVVSGVTYTPDGTVTDATHQSIHLYIPQAGSGTRSFWASTLGFNGTTPPACVHDTSEVTNAPVEEHDGTVYAGDSDAFGPFSIAQFVAQTNGHHDRRHHVAIHNLNGVAPLTGTTLNSNYPIRREVYNVALRTAVTNGAGGLGTNSALSLLLVSRTGAPSRLCQDALTISAFGFASLASAPLGHTCGQIADNLRAFDPATNPI